MLFVLVFFISLYSSISSLQCYHNCSLIYSMYETNLTSTTNCSLISMDRCSVKLIFWYQRYEYIVTYPGEFFNDPYVNDNRQFLMIETGLTNKFFSYDINFVCKDQDNCAHIYAQKRIIEMTQRTYNLSRIYNDLEKILQRYHHSSNDLACFDTNEAIRQCAISNLIGSCQIVDDLVKRKLHRRSCQRSSHESASVNIYDSGSSALMTVKCNRMLCNGPLTIEAVKKVLKYYNLTDINGRLPGKSSSISSMSVLLFFAIIRFFFFFSLFL